MTDAADAERARMGRAEDLDMDRVAALLLQVPLTSCFLRHTSLQSTLDYIHALPGDGPELAYVKDLLTLGTQEIIGRWYGGPEVAMRVAGDMMADVITQLRERAP